MSAKLLNYVIDTFRHLDANYWLTNFVEVYSEIEDIKWLEEAMEVRERHLNEVEDNIVYSKDNKWKQSRKVWIEEVYLTDEEIEIQNENKKKSTITTISTVLDLDIKQATQMFLLYNRVTQNEFINMFWQEKYNFIKLLYWNDNQWLRKEIS